MDKNTVSAKLEGLIETLAAIEHERWAHWQKHMHAKGVRRPDGALVLPAEMVAQWESQIARVYAELTDEEKESDREQVRRYLPMIAAALDEPC